MWAYTFAGVCFAAAVVFMFTLLQPYLREYDRILKENEVTRRKKAEKEANNVETKELLSVQHGDANPI
jgi:hypothetical protein